MITLQVSEAAPSTVPQNWLWESQTADEKMPGKIYVEKNTTGDNCKYVDYKKNLVHKTKVFKST